MTLKCEKIENLLPAYVESDLSASEQSLVDEHVQACASCTESLAEFRALETVLLDRRLERTSVTQTERAVARRLGFGRRHRVVDALVSLPGVLSAALIAFGVLFLYRGEELQSFWTTFAERFTAGAPAFVRTLTDGLNTATGGEEWAVWMLYSCVAALICLIGSWMLLRHVRE